MSKNLYSTLLYLWWVHFTYCFDHYTFRWVSYRFHLDYRPSCQSHHYLYTSFAHHIYRGNLVSPFRWCKDGGTPFKFPNTRWKKVITAWKSERKFFIYFCWPSIASDEYFLGQSKNRHLCPISIIFVRLWTLWEEMPLKRLAMHCKSVSYILILGNLLIFWIPLVNGGIKQSLPICYQKM